MFDSENFQKTKNLRFSIFKFLKNINLKFINKILFLSCKVKRVIMVWCLSFFAIDFFIFFKKGEKEQKKKKKKVIMKLSTFKKNCENKRLMGHSLYIFWSIWDKRRFFFFGYAMKELDIEKNIILKLKIFYIYSHREF